MVSFSWWVTAIIIMSIYWPITVMVAAAIVATAFMGTQNVGWRIVWSLLAILLVLPVIWFHTIS